MSLHSLSFLQYGNPLLSTLIPITLLGVTLESVIPKVTTAKIINTAMLRMEKTSSPPAYSIMDNEMEKLRRELEANGVDVDRLLELARQLRERLRKQ